VPGGYTQWNAGATTGTTNSILTGDTVLWTGSQGISTENRSQKNLILVVKFLLH